MIQFKNFLISILILSTTSFSAQEVRKMIFEEQKIEGKIRRPQLVLIKADERPSFAPMVLQSLGKSGNITDMVDEELIEKSPYKKAFKFQDSKINNYVP